MVEARSFTIISEDMELFQCNRDTVNLSEVLKGAIVNCSDGTTGAIPISVKGKVLGKVIEWCERHQGTNDNHLDWDILFVQKTTSELCDIMMAASYLEINELTYLCAKSVAKQVTGKCAKQLNANLNLSGDFEQVELHEITEENGGVI